MTEWQAFPQNTPDDNNEAKLKDYVVLAPNPNFIKKIGHLQNAPRYLIHLAYWVGDCFLDEQMRPLDVHYFLTLPPHN